MNRLILAAIFACTVGAIANDDSVARAISGAQQHGKVALGSLWARLDGRR
jgi:hypothetical protein